MTKMQTIHAELELAFGQLDKAVAESELAAGNLPGLELTRIRLQEVIGLLESPPHIMAELGRVVTRMTGQDGAMPEVDYTPNGSVVITLPSTAELEQRARKAAASA